MEDVCFSIFPIPKIFDQLINPSKIEFGITYNPKDILQYLEKE